MNYYLKGKINGQIESEAVVIPEIDVCKCKPWDPPEESLIKLNDPELFFFAPRDRKYPNGHRSNRATVAGYWKATWKDRTIWTRPPSPTVIGMKKTLVFHRGRAPKGERTHWIMHEYRTVERDFEEQNNGLEASSQFRGSSFPSSYFETHTAGSCNETGAQFDDLFRGSADFLYPHDYAAQELSSMESCHGNNGLFESSDSAQELCHYIPEPSGMDNSTGFRIKIRSRHPQSSAIKTIGSSIKVLLFIVIH